MALAPIQKPDSADDSGSASKDLGACGKPPNAADAALEVTAKGASDAMLAPDARRPIPKWQRQMDRNTGWWGRCCGRFYVCLAVPVAFACFVSSSGYVFFLAQSPFLVQWFGSIPRVITAMQGQQKDPWIQGYGCAALAKLSDGYWHGQAAIGEAGGLEIIARALSENSEHAWLQKYACSAISKVVFDHSGNNERALQAGCIEHVLAVMRGHLGDASIQTSALDAIASLSFMCKENVLAIVSAGGIELILAALKTHAGNPALQASALRALTNTVAESATAAEMVRQSAGVPPIMAAFHRFEIDPSIQRDVCLFAARFVGVDNASKAAFLQAGGLEQLVKALKNHQDAPMVLTHALVAIANLAFRDVETAKLASGIGTIELVLSSLRAFPDDVNLQSLGLAALANIACPGPCNVSSISDTIIQGGGIELIVQASHMHPVNPDVQAYSCSALIGLVSSAEGKAAVENLNHTDWVMAAARSHHARHEFVQAHCCQVLEELRGPGAPEVRWAGCLTNRMAAPAAQPQISELIPDLDEM